MQPNPPPLPPSACSPTSLIWLPGIVGGGISFKKRINCSGRKFNQIPSLFWSRRMSRSPLRQSDWGESGDYFWVNFDNGKDNYGSRHPRLREIGLWESSNLRCFLAARAWVGGGALLSFGSRFRNIPEQNVPRSQLSLLPWELSVTQSGRLMGGPTRAGAVVSNSSLGVTRCINGLQGSPWYFNCEVSLSGTI